MANLQDRYLLDVNQALAQLGRVDAAVARIAARRNINLDSTSLTQALSRATALRTALNGLGGPGTRTLSIRMSTASLTGANSQILATERSIMRLTAAAGANLGMTQRLTGVFGFIPGPLGLFASGAAVVTDALSGLTVAQRLNTIGAYALVGGLAAIGIATASLASHGVKQLGEFQNAVNILNAQGPNLGANLDEQIRALQEAGGRAAQQFNRAELGNGVADLTKQGLEGADALKVAATGYKIAGAEGTNLVETNKLLLSTLRQFGKDGPEAAAAAAKFGDVFAKGSIQAASGAKELMEGLAVVGPLADKANFSLEETVGILVALDNKGLKASTVGANAFRAVLMALASPTGVARKEIDKLGVATRNLDGSARDVRDILMDLRKAAAVSGQTYDQATQSQIRQADSVAAASTIFRSRGVVGFLNMTDATDKYIAALQDSEGALDQYANALTEGPAKAQERVRKSVDDLALSFAQTFGPKLSTALDSLSAFIRGLDKLTQSPDSVKDYLNAIAVGIGGVTLALTLNTLASKGALGAGGFAAFVKLLQATAAAQIFAKTAASLALIRTELAIGFAANGLRGALAVLMAIPAAAGLALAATTLFAAGTIAANFKIAGDVKATYDQIDERANQAQEKLMARVKELSAQGPLGKLKAKQLLLIELRFNQENTPEQNASLDKRLASVKAEIKAQVDADAARLAASKSKENDVAATAEQTDAYDDLIQRLKDVRAQFSDSGATTFEKDLQGARKALDDFNASVDKALEKGELTPTQGDALKKRAQQERGGLIQGIVDKQLKADEELRLKHEREVQDAQLAIQQDGRKKREAELQREVDDTRKLYGEQISEARTNAKSAPTSSSRAKFTAQAVALARQETAAIKAIRAKGAADLDKIDDDRLEKVKAAQRELLGAQGRSYAAATAQLVQERDRAVALAGDVPAARLAAEQRFGPQILRLQEAQAALSGQAQRSQLLNTLTQSLQDAKAAGGRRAELELTARRTYQQDLSTLEQSEETAREGRITDQETRIQRERLAIYKKGLDERMKRLDEATGAELASLQRVLQAERARAVASGNAGQVGAIDDALERLGDLNLDRVKEFKKSLAETSAEAGALRRDLREASQTPLEAAITSATAPIDKLLISAREQLTELRKAFGNVASPTPAQAALFRAREAELTAIVIQGTAQRGKLKADAEIQFQQAELQRDVEFATTKEKRLAALAAANAGDERRVQGLDAQVQALRAQGGAERDLNRLVRERDDVQHALTERKREEQDLDEELRASAQARLDAELKLNERLAQTDADLADVRGQAMTNLLDQVARLDARIADTTGESEKNDLAVTRLGLYGQILDLQETMDRAGVEAEQRRLTGLRAQRALTQELAGQGGGPVADSERAAQDARDALAIAERKVSVARTSAAFDEAATERAGALLGLSQAQRALSQARLADEDRRLAQVQTEVRAEATLAGIAEDSAAGRRLELAITRQNLAETNRRIAQADELLLTDEQRAALQEKRTGLLVQETQQARELARLQVDALRAQVDFSEAATRSALTRSRAAGDQVALARVDLAATRERLRLNVQEQAAAAAQNLSDGERLDLQKARLDLLAQEAEGVRKLAAAERARVELQRALRDALDNLQTAAQGQGGDTGLTRTQAQLTRTQLKLREAEADADSLLLSLERTGGALGWEEAEQGRARVDALTGAISEYRASLNAVADAYDEQISGLDSVIDATSRLNDLSRAGDTSDRAAAAFTLQVAETRRQQALADTDRLLSDQSATYAQIAAAAGRVAQAEQDRAATLNATVQSLGEDFLKRAADPNANSNQFADALRQAGLDSTQRINLINRLRRGEKDALKDVQTVISDEAGRQLDQLRQRALKGLGEIDKLRAQSFQARADAARQFEEYARLSSAVRIADAGFNELEATQLAAVTRQEELQQLIAKTSAVNPNAIRRDEAQRTLKAENDALVKQAQLRLNLRDSTKVTREDLTLQRDINREVTLELQRQRAVQELGATGYQEASALTQETSRALDRANAQLAEQVKRRRQLGGLSPVTRQDLEDQRAINLEVAKYVELQKDRKKNILTKEGRFNSASDEVQIAQQLEAAQESAFLGSQSRRQARIAYEVQAAIEIAKAVAGNNGVQAAQAAAEVKRQTAVLTALAPLQQQLDQERAAATARSTRAALSTVALPDLTAQATERGSEAGQAFAAAFAAQLRAALSQPVNITALPVSRADPRINSITNSIVNHYHFNTTVNDAKEMTPQDVIRLASNLFDQKVSQALTAKAWAGGGCR
ncbi:phage tail tape measure protein (plasmid) [Deinococcus aquaticus]|uniref:Phage tail tape measure protein n=1 Tax=Deinococcus aquaticus TaxID=328692 RepID=A0ABY7V657_9DEIO|nr:phage tail tape measure protein [Deinococcus aquaticus]WDA60673.1 phage tail tape measure protein [Deinococcus aquaticus]